jgi:hypothetical protein
MDSGALFKHVSRVHQTHWSRTPDLLGLTLARVTRHGMPLAGLPGHVKARHGNCPVEPLWPKG